jgi:hypothetical protein
MTAAHVPGPISRLLMADHERLDALLRRAFATPGAVDHEAYAVFRKGLLRHIGMEEKILLPAAQRARGGEPLACAARLRLDHGALAALLVPSPTAAIGNAIRTILERHNALEEIEGFFDVCRARGLTGRQGVIIPGANARHLMLREDLVEAVRDGKFRIHAIATVDEGLALLSGRDAGMPGPDGRFREGTFNAAVERALEANVARLKELRE